MGSWAGPGWEAAGCAGCLCLGAAKGAGARLCYVQDRCSCCEVPAGDSSFCCFAVLKHWQGQLCSACCRAALQERCHWGGSAGGGLALLGLAVLAPCLEALHASQLDSGNALFQMCRFENFSSLYLPFILSIIHGKGKGKRQEDKHVPTLWGQTVGINENWETVVTNRLALPIP